MADLIMMIGAPASGKSTLAQEIINERSFCNYFSRDQIRFSMLQEGEDYFAHETDVFNEFVDLIVLDSLSQGWDAIADATHLNKLSRRKLLDAIKERYTFTPEDRIIAIYCWVKDPEILKARNAKREGLARVPDDVIDNMFKKIQPPSYDEGFDMIFSYNANKEDS